MTDSKRGDGSFEVDLRAADDLAAAAIQEEQEHAAVRASAPEPGGSPKRGLAAPVVVVICLAVVASQLPSLRAAFSTPPSIRVGAEPGDDAPTEACVDTLWKISRLMQYSTYQEDEVLEPVTQRPYVVRHDGGDMVVECPNPGAHNLRSLHVSTAHRAPEALQ
jgi:hypothetical protein